MVEIDEKRRQAVLALVGEAEVAYHEALGAAALRGAGLMRRALDSGRAADGSMELWLRRELEEELVDACSGSPLSVASRAGQELACQVMAAHLRGAIEASTSVRTWPAPMRAWSMRTDNGDTTVVFYAAHCDADYVAAAEGRPVRLADGGEEADERANLGASHEMQ